MNSHWLLIALSVVVLSPSFLRAQAPGNSQPRIGVDAGESADNKMHEDIEIFCRILNRKLEPLYPRHTCPCTIGMMGVQGGMMGMQGGMMGVQGGMMGMQGGMMGMMGGTPVVIQVSTLEGVYLKGQGIVYTATLSSLQPPSKAAKVETTKKPVSEWDSIRRQLHNEKEEPKKAEATKPPTLNDVLLKLLAENGHHFSRLGENESLTLVLTVHDKRQSTETPKSRNASEKKGSQPSPSGQRENASPHPSSEIPHSSNFVRDMEVLGDLHLKQGHYADALKEYKKVAKMNPKADIYRKLAQCYLALGMYGEARSAIDQALALTKEGADKKDKPAPRFKPSAELPVKLIISAPKKLLDQVKEGKITFAEFRGKAHVETLRFENRR